MPTREKRACTPLVNFLSEGAFTCKGKNEHGFSCWQALRTSTLSCALAVSLYEQLRIDSILKLPGDVRGLKIRSCRRLNKLSILSFAALALSRSRYHHSDADAFAPSVHNKI